MTPYVPVPVHEASQIAEKYAKAIVIIMAWDAQHGLLHTTTYGTDPQNKAWAAQGGEIASKALGGVLDQSTQFQDYRLEQARKLLAALKTARCWMPSANQFAESFDAQEIEAIKQVDDAIAEAEKYL